MGGPRSLGPPYRPRSASRHCEPRPGRRGDEDDRREAGRRQRYRGVDLGVSGRRRWNKARLDVRDDGGSALDRLTADDRLERRDRIRTLAPPGRKYETLRIDLETPVR